MRLQAIQARNYRTLENIDLRFSPAYCTLSGKNNAGKSGIVRLLLNILGNPQLHPWMPEDYTFTYKEDLTQWVKGTPPITVGCTLCISRADDPALITFVEKVAQRTIQPDTAELAILLTIPATDSITTDLTIDGGGTDEQSAKEILKRLQSSNVLLLHNSTTRHGSWYYGSGRMKAFYDVFLSVQEQNAVSAAEQTVQRKIRQLAREHRDELNAMLGKLSAKYDVEFATLEGYATRRMPLGINLRDKTVEVPLNDWGSGTQNRTVAYPVRSCRSTSGRWRVEG